MFRKLKYNLERSRAAKAGRRSVSVEQAIRDFERYNDFFSFRNNAEQAGKKHYVRSGEGKTFKVVHREKRHSCYEIPQPNIIESIDEGDKGKQYKVYALPGKEFYQ